MKSKITSTSMLFAKLFTLIVPISSYSMHVHDDLALLNQQLTTLNQNIVTIPVQPTIIKEESKKSSEATQQAHDNQSLLYATLQDLQTKKETTPELYESAFITPLVTYADNKKYIILGQERNNEYSAFGGQVDWTNDGTAYATAAREFAEETSKTKENLSRVILITYDELKERLRSSETSAIVQNLPWTSRSTGKTRNLNTVNFLVNFKPAEIDYLRRNFQKTDEIKGLASILWDETFFKAMQAGRNSFQAKIILPGGNYQGGFTEIKLRPIFVKNMQCYLTSKDTGYLRTCELTPVLAPTLPVETKTAAEQIQVNITEQPAAYANMESKELASLQQFIDFNHPAYKPLLVDNKINYIAPKIVPVEIQPQIHIVQILTAWQDLPIKAFLGLSTGIKEAEHTLFELSYRDTRHILRLFNSYNGRLLTPNQESNLRTEFQNKDDIFLGGGPASCGYHAIKNLLLVTRLIFSQGASVQHYFARVGALLDLKYTNDLFGLPTQYQAITNQAGMGIWRSAIINQLSQQKGRREGQGKWVSDDNGEWLTDVGIMWLLNAIRNNKLSTKLDSLANQIVLNVLNQPNFIVDIYRGKELLEGFKKAYNSNKNFTGALFINPGAHWFTLMINKAEGKTQFIVIDSKNKPNYSSAPDQPVNHGARQMVEIISTLTRIAPEDIQQKLAPPALSSEDKKAREEQLKGLIPSQATSATAHLSRDAMRAFGMTDAEIDKALLDAKEAEKKKAK